MKPLLCLLFTLVCLQAIEATPEWSFERKEIPAPSLSHNIVGDADIQAIGVFLPPSYHTSDKAYPVIYHLHGWGDGIGYEWYRDMLREGWSKDSDKEFIWVQISGVNAFRGSFYTNSPITGNWEDFVSEDIVGFVDHNYRTVKDANHRAITGHSMGGTGCIHIGMNRPDVFSMVYSHSPGLFVPGDVKDWHQTQPDVMDFIVDLLAEVQEMPEADALAHIVEALETKNDWRVWFGFGYGMAWAGDKSLGVPYFPYEVVAGDDNEGNQKVFSEISEEVYDAGFGLIVDRIQQNREHLEQLKMLVIDCGYHDNFPWIYRGSVYFSDLLEQNKINHQLILHQGDHGSMLQHQILHSMFPLLTANFEAAE